MQAVNAQKANHHFIHLNRQLGNLTNVKVSDDVSYDVQPTKDTFKVWAIIFIVAFCLVIIANVIAFIFWWKKG